MNIFSSYKVKIKHYNHIFEQTIEIYRNAVSFFIEVCDKEWDVLEPLKSKEKLSFMDKLEMGSIAIATAALIGWSGWSAVDALTPDPPVPTYSLYMDGITAFLMTTQGVDPDDQEVDVETEGEDDTDATDTEETPEEPEVSETEEETDENEAETEDESDKQDTGTENVKKR